MNHSASLPLETSSDLTLLIRQQSPSRGSVRPVQPSPYWMPSRWQNFLSAVSLTGPNTSPAPPVSPQPTSGKAPLKGHRSERMNWNKYIFIPRFIPVSYTVSLYGSYITYWHWPARHGLHRDGWLLPEGRLQRNTGKGVRSFIKNYCSFFVDCVFLLLPVAHTVL